MTDVSMSDNSLHRLKSRKLDGQMPLATKFSFSFQRNY